MQDTETGEVKDVEEQKEQVSFEAEVEKAVSARPWDCAETVNSLGGFCNTINKYNGDFFMLCNQILESAQTDAEIKEIDNVPGLETGGHTILLAMAVQNVGHAVNSKRVQAITEGTVVDVWEFDRSLQLLTGKLRERLMNKLRESESKLVAKFKDS